MRAVAAHGDQRIGGAGEAMRRRQHQPRRERDAAAYALAPAVAGEHHDDAVGVAVAVARRADDRGGRRGGEQRRQGEEHLARMAVRATRRRRGVASGAFMARSASREKGSTDAAPLIDPRACRACRAVAGSRRLRRRRDNDARAPSKRVCLSAAETREEIKSRHLREPFAVLKHRRAAFKSEALSAKLCRIDDEFLYEIALLHRDGKYFHAHVDATTGKIVETKRAAAPPAKN